MRGRAHDDMAIGRTIASALVASLRVGTRAPPLCGAWHAADRTERREVGGVARVDGGAPPRLSPSMAAERRGARSHLARPAAATKYFCVLQFGGGRLGRHGRVALGGCPPRATRPPFHFVSCSPTQTPEGPRVYSSVREPERTLSRKQNSTHLHCRAWERGGIVSYVSPELDQVYHAVDLLRRQMIAPRAPPPRSGCPRAAASTAAPSSATATPIAGLRGTLRRVLPTRSGRRATPRLLSKGTRAVGKTNVQAYDSTCIPNKETTDGFTSAALAAGTPK
jgi:hypothetical protein